MIFLSHFLLDELKIAPLNGLYYTCKIKNKKWEEISFDS